MRALGPGSVSSLLKTILDVVFAALWIGVVGVSVMALLALLFSSNPDVLPDVSFSPAAEEITHRGPMWAGGLMAIGLYMGGVLVIVERLRKIFATLTAGDPFHPDNVKRLRVIGLMLSGLEIGRYAFRSTVAWLLPEARDVGGGVSLTPWFSVLVVFVLAEVFREGARLRREAELTI